MALITEFASLLFVGTSIDAINAAIRRFPEQAIIGNIQYHYKFITMAIKPFDTINLTPYGKIHCTYIVYEESNCAPQPNDIKCWTQWQSQINQCCKLIIYTNNTIGKYYNIHHKNFTDCLYFIN